jgi:toxin ParE1/3/4
MRRLRVTLPAQREIAAILEASLERWGEDARRRYTRVLEETLRALGDDPSGPLTQNRSAVARGYRSLHTKHARSAAGVRGPVHVVYFRVTATTVIVLAVLHERMDARAQLVASQDRPRRRR